MKKTHFHRVLDVKKFWWVFEYVARAKFFSRGAVREKDCANHLVPVVQDWQNDAGNHSIRPWNISLSLIPNCFFCAICLSFCCFINLKAFFCPLHFLFIIFALFFAVTLCYPLHLRALLHFFTMKLRDQDTQLSPAMYNFSFLSHKAAESSTSSSYKTSESSKQWYRWKKKI